MSLDFASCLRSLAQSNDLSTLALALRLLLMLGLDLFLDVLDFLLDLLTMFGSPVEQFLHLLLQAVTWVLLGKLAEGAQVSLTQEVRFRKLVEVNQDSALVVASSNSGIEFFDGLAKSGCHLTTVVILASERASELRELFNSGLEDQVSKSDVRWSCARTKAPFMFCLIFMILPMFPARRGSAD